MNASETKSLCKPSKSGRFVIAGVLLLALLFLRSGSK